jgi:hypothetical protein
MLPERAGEHDFPTALHGLRADALDCLQTTLALVADRSYGSGSHTVLGCRWRLQTDEHNGLAFVRRSLHDRLDEARDLLGLRVARRWSGLDGPGMRRLLASSGPLYVVGEAYDMPWLPYHGHQFMSHSFLLVAVEGGYTVVDAYHNNTAWGPARPGTWTLSAAELDRVLTRTALALVLRPAPSTPAVDPTLVLAGNAARARRAGHEIERYVGAVHAQLDRPGAAERLTLDIWLLSRERALHAAWLTGIGRRDAGARAVRLSEAWQRLATASYVALRRTQRGAAMARSVVDDLADQLRDDAAFAADHGPVTVSTPARGAAGSSAAGESVEETGRAGGDRR